MNRAARADARADAAVRLGVRPGDMWTAGTLTVVCGQMEPDEGHGAVAGGCLLLDPPHDCPDMYDADGTWSSVIALTDCRYAGAVVARLGPPRWVFVWDCIGSVYRRGQPRRSAKLALWYGDAPYNERGYTYEKGIHPEWMGGLFLADVFRKSLASLHGRELHRHAKPVEWLACLIGNTSPAGAAVIDPFMGGGAALEAAHLLGRPYRGWDTNPEAVAVAMSRPAVADLDWSRVT